MALFQELKRRNVIRVGIAYVLIAWLVLQVTDVISQILELPAWAPKLVLMLLAIGLPLALLFAWAFELTPDGLKRDSEARPERLFKRRTGQRLNRVIVLLLAAALAYFAVDKFVLRDPPIGPEAVLETNGAPEAEGKTDARSLPDDRSIAVLPFRMAGQDGEDEAFVAGIHNGLVTRLARISALRLVSRASAEAAAGRDVGLRQIAELLNVANILEGQMQRSGDQVRISLHLVNVASDTYLWAETYDRALTADNLFAIQDEIARAVSDAVAATLTDAEEHSLGNLPTRDLQALELYFRGLAIMEARGVLNLESARELFNQAHTRDPEFAQALAAEAKAILLHAHNVYGILTFAEAAPLAEPLIDRAFALAPDDPLVLYTKGSLADSREKPEEAVAWYRRALEINPVDADAITGLRTSLIDIGEWAELRDLLRQAVIADPLSRVALSNAAGVLSRYRDSDPREIEELLRRLERVDPAWAWYERGWIAEYDGRLVEAVEHYQKALIMNPDHSLASYDLAMLLAGLGLSEAARSVVPDGAAHEFWIAASAADWPQALAIAQGAFEANPQDPEVVGRLAIALLGSGEYEEALRLGLIVWEAAGRNPYLWTPANLLHMVWVGRITERQSVVEEFTAAAHKVLDKVRADGAEFHSWEFAFAMLAVIEGRSSDAIAHLAMAIDLGFRDLAALDMPVWEPLADSLDFRDQVRRLNTLIAKEQQQVMSLLCRPGGLLAEHGRERNPCLGG